MKQDRGSLANPGNAGPYRPGLAERSTAELRAAGGRSGRSIAAQLRRRDPKRREKAKRQPLAGRFDRLRPSYGWSRRHVAGHVRRGHAVDCFALPRCVCERLPDRMDGSGPPAPPQTLPTHFAGEALTVALAFCFPALAAGAYLGVQRINARLGARSLAALLVAVVAIGATAYLVEDAGSLLQRAGLAKPPTGDRDATRSGRTLCDQPKTPRNNPKCVTEAQRSPTAPPRLGHKALRSTCS